MKVEQREIDGIRYTISQMPATLSVKVFARLCRLLGEPVVRLIAGAVDSKEQLTAEQFAIVISGVFHMLDEDQAAETIKDLLRGAKCNRLAGFDTGADAEISGAFDSHFSGRILHLLKVAQFAIETNYHDFFAASPWPIVKGSETEATTSA